MDSLIEDLKQEFEITVNTNPKSFLGMEIEYLPGKIKLTQKNYSLKILEKYNMNESKPVDTPSVKREEMENRCTKDSSYYREAIGSLLYLTTKTRPDMAQAVGFGSRYVNNPTNQNLIDLKRMFRGT